MGNTFQLQPLNDQMAYSDLVQALSNNMAILLQAYVHGANAMIFKGNPGLAGQTGVKGASFLVFNKAVLSEALSGFYTELTFNAMYADTEALAAAVSSIFTSKDKTTLLFQNQPMINSLDDLAIGDVLMFDNGKILTVDYEGGRYIATSTFSTDVLTNITGMTATQISELVDTVFQAGVANLTAVMSSEVTVNEEIMYLPNLDFSSLTSYDIDLSKIVSKCIWTCFKTVNPGQSISFVVGTTEQANEVFGKLALGLGEGLPNLSTKSPMWVLQERSTGTPAKGTKYGAMFLDMATNVSANTNMNTWNVIDDKLDISKFATIVRHNGELWILSHCTKTAVDNFLGKLILSSERFQVQSNHITLAGITDILLSSPAILLTMLKNATVIGTDATGKLVDAGTLFEPYVANQLTDVRKANLSIFNQMDDMSPFIVADNPVTGLILDSNDSIGFYEGDVFIATHGKYLPEIHLITGSIIQAGDLIIGFTIIDDTMVLLRSTKTAVSMNLVTGVQTEITGTSASRSIGAWGGKFIIVKSDKSVTVSTDSTASSWVNGVTTLTGVMANGNYSAAGIVDINNVIYVVTTTDIFISTDGLTYNVQTETVPNISKYAAHRRGKLVTMNSTYTNISVWTYNPLGTAGAMLTAETYSLYGTFDFDRLIGVPAEYASVYHVLGVIGNTLYGVPVANTNPVVLAKFDEDIVSVHFKSTITVITKDSKVYRTTALCTL